MTTFRIGLDLSLNNSGIYCKHSKSNQETITEHYAILRPSWSSKHKSSTITTVFYERWNDDNYEVKQVFDVKNCRKQSYAIISYLAGILEEIAGISKMALVSEAPPTRINPRQTNSQIELIRSNSIVYDNVLLYLQNYCKTNGIEEFTAAMCSNTSIKRVAGVRGRGSCKDQIVDSWKSQLHNEWFDFTDKLDDIADAYFASKWGEQNTDKMYDMLTHMNQILEHDLNK